jgi:hypothetical protein
MRPYGFTVSLVSDPAPILAFVVYLEARSDGVTLFWVALRDSRELLSNTTVSREIFVDPSPYCIQDPQGSLSDNILWHGRVSPCRRSNTLTTYLVCIMLPLSRSTTSECSAFSVTWFGALITTILQKSLPLTRLHWAALFSALIAVSHNDPSDKLSLPA